jgi:hypothetical protein
MDYDALRFWLDLLQWGLTAVVAVYVWASRRHQVTDERIQQLEATIRQRLDVQDARLVRVERDLEHVPTHQDFRRFDDALAGLHKEMGRVAGELGSMRQAISLIQDHLLNRDRP